MKTTEVNSSVIGKKVRGIFTGLVVTGTIIDTVEVRNPHNNELCAVGVRIKLDNGVAWGDCTYHEYESTARIHDEFGNLAHTTII